jgi:hypothetical protein
VSTITKEAAKDAAEFAAAKMAYGEGAGTRRKLIETAVDYKANHLPGYARAFEGAYAGQDFTKHIKSAKRSRKAADVGALTSKNIKALARGDRSSMSTPLIVGITVGVILHQTGYDKKIWAYGKRKTGDVRAWLKNKL